MTTHSKTANHSNPEGTAGQAPKLLDRLRIALEARRYQAETVGRFVDWNRQFILFHNKRHPKMMGREEIEEFLSHLALAGHGAELQAEARQAPALLYREILGIGRQPVPLIVEEGVWMSARCQKKNPFHHWSGGAAKRMGVGETGASMLSSGYPVERPPRSG